MPANQSTPEVTRALKPCPNPWCGSHDQSDAELFAAHRPIVVADGAVYMVCCPVCPLNGPRCATEADGIAAWNTRTPARGGDELREAEQWLRAISDWLLTHDHDMTLPDGILDTDPLDIADRLAALASTDMADAGEGSIWDSYRLPCDVHLAPATIIKAGCRLATLKVAMEVPHRPKHFEGHPNDALSAAPPVEGLTSGEGAVTPAMIDAAKRYVRGEDDAIGWAIEAALAASPKATATASVRGFDLDDGEWFYPEGDHSSDECRHSADEVIDYALEGGAKSQVVCIERATSLPAVYAAVRVFTDAEKDERNSDDDYAYTLFATAEEARASLTHSGTAATIGGERA